MWPLAGHRLSYDSIGKSERTGPFPARLGSRLRPWTSDGSVTPAASAKVAVQSRLTARSESVVPGVMCPSQRMISGTRPLSFQGTRFASQRWEPADHPLSEAKTMSVSSSLPVVVRAFTMSATASSTASSERQRSSIVASEWACWFLIQVSRVTHPGSPGPTTPTFGERGGEKPLQAVAYRAGGIAGVCGACGAYHRNNGWFTGVDLMNATDFCASTSVE